jgi:hypothetical protein
VAGERRYRVNLLAEKCRRGLDAAAGESCVSPDHIAIAKDVNGATVLALKPRDAAAALGISPRLLWTMTAAGKVPFVRLGEKRLVYPVDLLREWLRQQAKEVSQ